ncbi:peptidoglycan-binding protein [Streptomyces sp. NBC_00287]|uniref:peptidoglycan-binding domain-containing protein n=1 Tax=Streptomyces sp. NBC_00287 TaxID=2975702 RepID=UPI002E2D1D66|nr:peptidoglycan-binding domain-containing protein [Streptomyces sp. NBC_00287]
MKLKLASLGAATLMFSGLGLIAPSTATAATSCASNVAIWKTESTYIQLPTTSGGNITCEMSQGAQGPHVRALQNALNNCYGAGLDADTIFGTKTYNALRDAQAEAGTGDDGIYGPLTRDALEWPRFNKSGYFTGYCAKR